MALGEFAQNDDYSSLNISYNKYFYYLCGIIR